MTPLLWVLVIAGAAVPVAIICWMAYRIIKGSAEVG
jgi:hypothetical protein